MKQYAQTIIISLLLVAVLVAVAFVYVRIENTDKQQAETQQTREELSLIKQEITAMRNTINKTHTDVVDLKWEVIGQRNTFDLFASNLGHSLVDIMRSATFACAYHTRTYGWSELDVVGHCNVYKDSEGMYYKLNDIKYYFTIGDVWK